MHGENLRMIREKFWGDVFADKKDKCFGVYKTAGEKTRSGGYTPIHPAGAVALNENTETAEEKDR